MRVRLDNMVASAYFYQPIDIAKIKDRFENAVYDKKTFPALIIRFFDIGTTVLLFSSGKAVITGAKSHDDVNATMSKLLQKIPEISTKVPSVDIVNTVYTIETGTEFNLDEIALSLPNCEYDPEQFTGLVYRPKGIKAVLLIFSSGNMVCSGAKTLDDVYTALNSFYRDAKKYNVPIQIPEEISGGDEEW